MPGRRPSRPFFAFSFGSVFSIAGLGGVVCGMGVAALGGACSSSSSSGFVLTGDGGASDTGASNPDSSGATDSAPAVDSAIPLASGAVTASLSGDNCQDRLALMIGTLSPASLVANGGTVDGGDAVNIACELTAATKSFAVSFGLATGESFGFRGNSSAAIFANSSVQYAGTGCTLVASQVQDDTVSAQISCTTTTVSSGGGAPDPSMCEIDATFQLAGCEVL